MTAANGFWAGRRVLVTGHTGFKGPWLALWLSRLGARVTAVALPAQGEPNLWDRVRPVVAVNEVLGDVRDAAVMAKAVASEPEVVLHLAAQSLVRRGYAQPAETFAVNVLGTARVLDATLAIPSVRAVLVVTSDKVYAQNGSASPFREGSRLAGEDPYSASKAAIELLVSSYRTSFFAPRGLAVATARAGNVIGGGDRSVDRLVPDAVRMLEQGRPLALRYPNASRPWQHVLDPLRGYLMFAERLLTQPEDAPPALNFGPGVASCISTREVVERLARHWGGAPTWYQDENPCPPEAPALLLASDLAAATLGWRPLLELDEALAWTAEWYRRHRHGEDAASLCNEQLDRYEARARAG